MLCCDDPDISNDVSKDTCNEINPIQTGFEETTLTSQSDLNIEANAQQGAVELVVPSNHVAWRGTRLELGYSLKLSYELYYLW